MSDGGNGQTRDQVRSRAPRRSMVVLAAVLLVWVAIVIAYGTYVVRTVGEGGVASVPVVTTLIVTPVVIAIPWLHWRLTRVDSAINDDRP